MTDLTTAVDAAARALFDRNQAQRLDSGRLNPATGNRWTWEDLTPIDKLGYRSLVLPIVTAAAPLIHCACTDDHQVMP